MAAASFGQIFDLFNALRKEALIEDYAIVGAIGALFYAEATSTFDLDVAVALPGPPGSLLSLGPLYQALRERGFREEREHVWIHGVPVQFLPGDGGFWKEAVEGANELDYDGIPVRVATAEHLVAMAWLAPEPKRLQRAATLLQDERFSREKLRSILQRHDIPDRTPS